MSRKGFPRKHYWTGSSVDWLGSRFYYMACGKLLQGTYGRSLTWKDTGCKACLKMKGKITRRR